MLLDVFWFFWVCPQCHIPPRHLNGHWGHVTDYDPEPWWKMIQAISSFLFRHSPGLYFRDLQNQDVNDIYSA
jgi:hypothetical protein